MCVCVFVVIIDADVGSVVCEFCNAAAGGLNHGTSTYLGMMEASMASSALAASTGPSPILSDRMLAMIDRRQAMFKEEGKGRKVVVLRNESTGRLIACWRTEEPCDGRIIDKKCISCGALFAYQSLIPWCVVCEDRFTPCELPSWQPPCESSVPTVARHESSNRDAVMSPPRDMDAMLDEEKDVTRFAYEDSEMISSSGNGRRDRTTMSRSMGSSSRYSSEGTGSVNTNSNPAEYKPPVTESRPVTRPNPDSSTMFSIYDGKEYLAAPLQMIPSGPGMLHGNIRRNVRFKGEGRGLLMSDGNDREWSNEPLPGMNPALCRIEDRFRRFCFSRGLAGKVGCQWSAHRHRVCVRWFFKTSERPLLYWAAWDDDIWHFSECSELIMRCNVCEALSELNIMLEEDDQEPLPPTILQTTPKKCVCIEHSEDDPSADDNI